MVGILFKRSLQVLAAIVLTAGIFLSWVATTESGLKFALTQAAPMITAESVAGQLNNFQLQGVTVNLQAAQVKISQLGVAWTPMTLLAKRVQASELSATNVDVSLNSVTTEVSSEPWSGIDLPFDVEVNDFRLQSLVIKSATDNPFIIEQIVSEFDIINSQLRLQNFRLKSDLANVDIVGSIDLKARPQDTIGLQTTVTTELSEQGLLVEIHSDLDGTWQEFRATSNAVLTANNFAENAQASSAELALTGLIKGLLTPSPSLALEGRWSVPFSLQQTNSQPANSAFNDLSNQGNFEFSGLPADYRFNLAGTTFSNSTALLNVVANGQGGLDGVTLEQLRVQSTPQNELPVTNFAGAGELGWKEGLQWLLEGQLTDLEPTLLLGNSVSGLGQVSGQLTSRGQISETAQNPLGILGNVSAKGITATWQGLPLTADFQVDFLEQDIQVSQLAINSASFVLFAQGQIGDNSSLAWSVNASELKGFSAEFGGSLTGTGRVIGPITSPNLEFNLSGSGLQYLPRGKSGSEAWRIALLSSNAEMSQTDENAPFNLNLTATGVSQGEQLAADVISLELQGSVKNHTLRIFSQLPEQTNLSALMSGALLEISGKPLSQKYAWSGELKDLAIDSKQLAEWKLRAPAQLNLGVDQIRLERSCLAAAEQALCAELNLSLAESTQTVAMDLTKFDLAFFDKFLKLQDIKLEGSLDGRLDYALSGADAFPKIEVNLTGSSVRLGLPEFVDEEELDNDDVAPPNRLGDSDLERSSFSNTAREWLEFEDATVRISQTDAVQGHANLKLDDDHFLLGQLDSQRPFLVNNFREVPIAGRFELKWADLSMLPTELIGGTQMNGRLDASFDVDGTLAQPKVSMRSELSNASLFLPATGVTYTNISAKAVSQSDSIIDLDGRLFAGEGELTFVGEMDFSNLQSPQANLRLKGQQLSLLQTSDIDAVGGLDLTLSLANQISELVGDIVIEQADLQLGAQENVILASSDVVLQGEEADMPQAKQRLRLKIDLGDATKLNAAGLSAELQGRLGVTQDPGELMIGQGQIDVVNGVYRAYGEELTISKGQLIFNGGSVDNPRLDLEATRVLTNVIAGVRVQGTAQSPRLSLFANPSMSDQDVLSMLIFGKKLSSLGGEDSLVLLKIAASLSGDGPDRFTRMTNQLQNALGLSELELRLANDSPELVAGKQLTSRFYVGYGYGLLDAAQSLVLRFKINDAWSIQGDVGANNGADLRYQIER